MPFFHFFWEKCHFAVDIWFFQKDGNQRQNDIFFKKNAKNQTFWKEKRAIWPNPFPLYFFISPSISCFFEKGLFFWILSFFFQILWIFIIFSQNFMNFIIFFPNFMNFYEFLSFFSKFYHFYVSPSISCFFFLNFMNFYHFFQKFYEFL